VCGRFVRYSPPETFAEIFDAKSTISLPPSYNIAPSQAVLVARNREGADRELVTLHWGLLPAWAKEPKTGYSTINARAETVATKPTFRSAFRHRRCLIAADGFYEWKRLERTKQPYFIRLKEGQPFAFAGLWERWEREGHLIESCAIIVTEANDLMKAIHDRMPVILSSGDYETWMDPTLKDPEHLSPLLKPYPAAGMEAYPVAPLVNNPRNNKAELIARA
jgi:putative SOS response-associated peptidase YedK